MSSRPEQTFFQDPAIDRTLSLVMALAAELYVARDHVRVLEEILVDKGVLEAGEVDRYSPGPDAQAQRDADRDAFVAALLGTLSGQQVSKGAQ